MTRPVARRRGAGTALTGAVALVTLVCLVAGLPVLLYWLGGDPLPHQVPSWNSIATELLHRDDTGAVFLGAVRDLSWVAWAAFTAAVVAEAQAALRGRRPPRLRLGGMQNAAGWLVALTMIAFAGQPAAALAFAPSVPAAAAPATHTPAPADSVPADSAPADSAPPVRATETAAMANPSPQVMSMGFYQMVTVQPGDCLWTIAQRHLGNGDLYTEIAQLNLGHNMGGGQVFTNPSVIWPGWVLQVPASSGAAQPATGQPATGQPATGQSATGQPAQPSGPATSAAGQHGSHGSADPAFSQPHPSAGATDPAGDAAGLPAAPAQQPVTTQDPGAGVSAQPAPRPADAHATGGAAPAAQTTPAGQSDQIPELGMFAAGVLVGGASVALARMRRRQRQTRRPGRRIPLPASAPVIAVEQRLRAAAQRLHPDMTGPADTDPEPAYSDDVPGDLGFLDQAYSDAPPAEPGLAQLYSNGVSAGPSPLAYDGQETDADFFGYPSDDLTAAGRPEYQPDEPAEALLQPATALRAALSQLGAGLVAARRPVPEIAAVAVHRSGLDLLLATPQDQPPPAPFTTAGGPDPATWRLELPRHAPRQPLPPAQAGDLLPGLVTAGATADGGYLLIDTEHLGVTTVDGPADLADLVLATAAAELTTSQLAGWYDLILAGFPELGVVDGRATSCASVDEALDLLAAKAVTLRRRLGGADVRRQRIEEPGDEDWALTLLVSRTPPTSAQMAMLLDLASVPGGIAALVAGGGEPPEGHPAPASLRLREDPSVPGGISGHVSPVHLDVCPQPLSRDDYEALASLFATAADQGDVPSGTPPYDGSSWPPDPGLAGLQEPPEPDPEPELPADEELADDTPADQAEDDGPSLRIGVMGTFTINGTPAALQPAQGQLILALALNGSDGLSNAHLCYLLGADPDHPKPSDSLRQLIVRTRRQLGRAADGREWIEHLGAGQYALHPQARFDWADFEDLSERGMADRDPGCLHEALALIRGRPFTGCYHWWLDVAFTETVRAQIVDTADLLAELELAAADPSASARAARTGLAADPAAEQLWRAVMRAEHASGNLAGVREAWSRCLDAITDIAADGEPHPDTTALYQQLTGVTPAPSGWAGQAAAGLPFR
jgi:DNA-binding SARP family transcriptional activator